MIQRIQTIFLLVATLLGILCMFLPLGILPADTPEEANDPFFATESITTLILGVLVIVLPLTAVFLYAKRSVQLRMTFAGLIAVLVFTAFVLVVLSAHLSNVVLTVGSFLPLGYALFLALAIRGIRRDERLIRSMDRFR